MGEGGKKTYIHENTLQITAKTCFITALILKDINLHLYLKITQL